MPKLVVALSSGPLDVRGNAAEKLAALATTDELQSEIIAAGAARPLVSLLASNSPEVRMQAASCLMHLASSKSRREVVLAAGAVAQLWELVVGSSPASREEALGALCSLAVVDKAKAELQAAKAAAHLVGLLSSGSARSQVRVRDLLSILAEWAQVRDEIVAAGAVPGLVDSLKGSDEGGRVRATLVALASLNSGDLGCANLVRKATVKAGALPLLTGLLKSGSDEVKAAAAGAFAALAAEDPFVLEEGSPNPPLPVMAEEFININVFPPLVELLSLGNVEGRAQAVLAVSELVQKLDLQGPFIAAGGLPPLVAMLGSRRGDTAETRATSATTLRLLVTTAPENRELIEAAVFRSQRGREELLRTVHLYCL